MLTTTPHPSVYSYAASLLRIGGTLCLLGIPPGDVLLGEPVAALVIRGLKIQDNLVGSLAETMEAVEAVRRGDVKVHLHGGREKLRTLRDLGQVYGELERGEVLGRVVLKVADDE